MQRTVIIRFRCRNDRNDEDYLRVLKQLDPTLHYEIVFDPPDDSASNQVASSLSTSHCTSLSHDFL